MGVLTEVAVICCLLGQCRGYSVRAIGSSYVPVIGRAYNAGPATGNKNDLPVVNTDADWSDRVSLKVPERRPLRRAFPGKSPIPCDVALEGPNRPKQGK